MAKADNQVDGPHYHTAKLEEAFPLERLMTGIAV